MIRMTHRLRPNAEACAEFLHTEGAAPCVKALTRAIDAIAEAAAALAEADDEGADDDDALGSVSGSEGGTGVGGVGGVQQSSDDDNDDDNEKQNEERRGGGTVGGLHGWRAKTAAAAAVHMSHRGRGDEGGRARARGGGGGSTPQQHINPFLVAILPKINSVNTSQPFTRYPPYKSPTRRGHARQPRAVLPRPGAL
jgi:hypothetical protein